MTVGGTDKQADEPSAPPSLDRLLVAEVLIALPLLGTAAGRHLGDMPA